MMSAPAPTCPDRHLLQGRQHTGGAWTRETTTAIITFSGGTAEDFSGSEPEPEESDTQDVRSHPVGHGRTMDTGSHKGSGMEALNGSVGGGTLGGLETGQQTLNLETGLQRLNLILNEHSNCDDSNCDDYLNSSITPEVQRPTDVVVARQRPGSAHSERFNPFDRDMHIEESHYDNSPVKSPDNAQLNVSHSSDDCLSESDSLLSDPEDPAINMSLVTNAELGLAEDHFSLPEGTFGMSTAEELEMAIQNCKDLILDVPEPSDRRKNLVHKLIQLRIKLIETKEGPVEEEEDVKSVVGHRFKKRESTRSKHYCEKCASVIWGVLQAWYKCTACGFCCHDKCLNLIYRTCANLKVKENPNYILSICPEKGLDSQNYRCAECSTGLSFIPGLKEPRRCDYTGAYYCRRCHWNDVMILPARVIHNWDLEPRKVCRASKQFLRLMGTRACLRIQDINPMLFSLVEELNDVKKLREEILIMKKYFLSCQDALSSKLLLQLTTRQHFVESSDIYSLQDLMDVATDLLLPQLAKIHSSFAQHIKTDCQLCQAKGYMCELCDMREVLFPFDNIAIVCDRCSTVLHRHCFMRRNQVCPKCERMSQRAALITQMSEDAPNT